MACGKNGVAARGPPPSPKEGRSTTKPSRRKRASPAAPMGFGRVVATGTEVPILFANLVNNHKVDERSYICENATEP
jgi:hypothetical protein